jgi:hypothetical protein
MQTTNVYVYTKFYGCTQCVAEQNDAYDVRMTKHKNCNASTIYAVSTTYRYVALYAETLNDLLNYGTPMILIV